MNAPSFDEQVTRNLEGTELEKSGDIDCAVDLPTDSEAGFLHRRITQKAL
jgi:hypothetical protein